MTASDTEVLDAGALQHTIRDLFVRRGATESDADAVAAELILADRSGVPSHGVIRVGDYLAAIEAGTINTAAQPRTTSTSGPSIVIDGDRGFGQVVGRVALDAGIVAAEEHGVGLVIVRNSYHIGRIGSLCERGASAGHLVLALVAVGIPGPVAPFGGREGRLGTNPIAFGVPTEGSPIVADFATSAMPEGVVMLARQRGLPVPPGVLVDAEGSPTTDPAALYTTPPGAILPFGGAWGHRGFALNLMVELFAGALAGYGAHSSDRTSNCMMLMVVDPRAAHPGIDFSALVADTAAFVASSAPASDAPVMLPGEPESRSRERWIDDVPVATSTVDRLEALARTAGLSPLRATSR